MTSNTNLALPGVLSLELESLAAEWVASGEIVKKLTRKPVILFNFDDDDDSESDAGCVAENDTSAELKNFFDQILEPDITRRLGTSNGGAQGVKNHSWFKYVNFLDIFHERIPMVSKLPPDLTAVPVDTAIGIPRPAEVVSDNSGFDEFRSVRKEIGIRPSIAGAVIIQVRFRHE